MKIRTIAIAAGVLALGLATITPGMAQGPLYDRVNVTLPYPVTIGDRTLQPGDYVIQQLRDAGGGSRVLLIYSDNGMRFETSALTIPALDINTPEKTSVILHHFGKDYYFDKVWIQGKDYGYEFPLPDSVKARERERMAAVKIPATYTMMAQATQQQQTSTPVQQQTEAPTTTPSTPEPEPQANREEAPPPPPPMPHTSAGWLMMLLGGTSLSGAGLLLRRKR
jgi:hypothetical protein